MTILNEIANDVFEFKNLKDPDSAKDYKEKLVYINQRRDMISFLNNKYGSGSRTFLQILDTFKDDPSQIMKEPHSNVKKLIHDTLEKHQKES